MNQFFRVLAAGSGLLAGMVCTELALAQKQGGILRMFATVPVVWTASGEE